MSKLKTVISLLIRPIKRLLDRTLGKRIFSTVGLLPITEFSEEDVFIVGYPKSGNTWMQNLVAGLVYGVDPELSPDTIIQELVPDIHYKRYYKRFKTPMFFKSHSLPTPQFRRVIYLLRDGRDVMVSYYHFNKALRGENFDFHRMVQDGVGLFPCEWHEHVEAWLANPYNAEMIVVRYEDLKETPVETLLRICWFIGEDYDKAYLHRLASKANFNKMREKEIRYGWDDPLWPKEKFFVRRGQIGSYKDEFPQELLQIFLSKAGKTLEKLGYIDRTEKYGRR
ncbi:sulfotransferase domain-containing protein [Thermodesulfovibrio sp.]|uniref:sulfotransferase domain-containing protein n=1 Tax=Thermodesulfovibrio sp. TaxID=2067987 RepID=UPI0030A36A36